MSRGGFWRVLSVLACMLCAILARASVCVSECFKVCVLCVCGRYRASEKMRSRSKLGKGELADAYLCVGDEHR